MNRYQQIPANFIYPDIKEEYRFGSATEVAGTVLNPDGDWRNFTPPQELQRRNNIESSSCFIQASQHAIATIQEQQFNIADQNYSERFNLLFSDPSPIGGSPIDAANSIRHDGLIPDDLLPFSPELMSWEEFNSWKGGDQAECLVEGQRWLRQWEPKYDIVVTREEPVERKYTKLKEALRYSPLPVSVFAWVEDENGVYVKPEGAQDNHLVTLLHIDDANQAYIFDTYEPFVKKLCPNYNFEFGMRWSLRRKDPTETSNWLTELLASVWSFFKLLFNKPAYV